MEIWKDIKGYEGYYQISNLGNVKSLARIIKRCRNGNMIYNEKQLKPYKTGIKKRQYFTFRLYKNGVKKQIKLHTLLAIHFLNYNNDLGLVVDHIDNNPLNNDLKNLQIITCRDNIIKDMDRGISKYLGVTFNKNAGKYRAYYTYKGKQKHLGYFVDELKASKAYKEFIKNKLL